MDKDRPFYKRNISVFGMGYIGLPTAVILANSGYKVIGIDINSSLVESLNKGEVHIKEETGLKDLFKKAINNGSLIFSTLAKKSNIFIVAVPTPFKDNYEADLSYVESVMHSIAPLLSDSNLVIIESTCPIGTTVYCKNLLSDLGVPVDNIHFAYCPERVLPGNIIYELKNNDRIVGGLVLESTNIAAEFYRSFVSGQVLETDARTAEMSKLIENSSRDVEIAFANEVSILCDYFDVNALKLIDLCNHHPRVNILSPGVGVGGHCLAVDPWFIIKSANGNAKLLELARHRNIEKTNWVTEKIKQQYDQYLNDFNKYPKIALMGLSYKPNVSDLRESPSLLIAKTLINLGLDIVIVEPNIIFHPDFEIMSTKDAIDCADIVVYLVAHKEFYDLPVEHSRIVDFCGVTRSLDVS
jgi:UDP-N-acetyl-D-mannosaminuronic acid dehydrogenase